MHSMEFRPSRWDGARAAGEGCKILPPSARSRAVKNALPCCAPTCRTASTTVSCSPVRSHFGEAICRGGRGEEEKGAGRKLESDELIGFTSISLGE